MWLAGVSVGRWGRTLLQLNAVQSVHAHVRWRLGLLGVGLWVTACAVASDGQAPSAEARSSAVAAAAVDVVSGASPLEAVAARYRLAPDRRALLAGADVARLLGGDGAALDASWNGGSWTLQRGGAEVGRLPELPSYEDLTAWLDDVASALRGDARSGATAPAAASARSASSGAAPRVASASAGARSSSAAPTSKRAAARGSAAKRTAKRAATRSPTARRAATRGPAAKRAASTPASSPLPSVVEAFALARTAGARLATEPAAAFGSGAHALAALALQLPDAFGTNAGLAGRALALVTLARAEGTLAPADEVLVAAALGYRAAAARLAQALPVSHPVRAFALRDDVRLSALATPGARRLRLLRHVESGDAPGADRWVAEHLGAESLELHVIAARLELGMLGDGARFARATPDLLTLHARRELAAPGSAAHRALSGRGLKRALAALGDAPPWPRLDAAIAALPAPEKLGPLLAGAPGDEDLLRASYRSLAHGAFGALGAWAASQPSLVPQAEPVTESLNGDGAFGDDARWLSLYRGATARSLDAGALAAGVETLPFAGHALRRILDAAMTGVEEAGLEPLPLARAAARRLDTRVAHRELWSRVSARLLADPARAEALARSAFAEDPGGQPSLELWLARLDGELGPLQARLDDPRARVADKLDLLEMLLRERQLEPRELPRRITALGPLRRWGEVAPALRLLEAHGDRAGARRLAQEFLVVGELEGLAPVLARTAIARTFRAEERLLDAWQAIEPALDSEQSGALAQAALIQQALGRDAAALELAERNLRQHPTSEALGVLVEVHWRAHRPDAAAAALATRPLTHAEWRWTIGSRLASAVAGGSDLRAAVRALSRSRVEPKGVLSLLQALDTAPDHQTTLVEIYRGLRPPGLALLDVLAEAGRIVQRSRGRGAAATFLKAEVPADLLPAFAQLAFARRLDDALWSVVPLEVPGADTNACVWLLRASAALRAGPSERHREQLLAHFREQNPSRCHALGRYLLGLADEPSALALAQHPQRSLEVAYYLGLKADVERRLPEAVAWYRVALESGQPDAHETRLAFERLAAWRASGKSLSRLAALPPADLSAL